MKTPRKILNFFDMNRQEAKVYASISAVLLVMTLMTWGSWWVIIPGFLTGVWIRVLYTEYRGWERFYGNIRSKRRK